MVLPVIWEVEVSVVPAGEQGCVFGHEAGVYGIELWVWCEGFQLWEQGSGFAGELEEGEECDGAVCDGFFGIEGEAGKGCDGICGEVAADDFALCGEAAAVAGVFQQGDELGGIKAGEGGEGFRGEVLGADLDDEADVRGGPAEGSAFPGCEVDAAHGIDIGIGAAVGFDEGCGCLGFLEGCAVTFELMMKEGAFPPIDGEGCVVEFTEAGLVDEDGTAAGAAAVIGEGLDDFVFKVFVEAGVAVGGEAGVVVESDVPAAAVVGVIPTEHFHFRGDGDLDDVAGSSGVDFEAGAIRADAEDAAGAMLEGCAIAADGVHDGKIAECDVEVTIDTHGEAVGAVVCAALGVVPADSLNEGFLFLGDTIAIGIDEDGEVRRVDDVEAVMIPEEAARGIEVFYEFDCFIGASVVIGIAEADNTAAVWFDLFGTISIGGDVEIAIGSSGYEDGVVD